jgi:ABC-type nickel/cobalt efflux system permease component RcnA
MRIVRPSLGLLFAALLTSISASPAVAHPLGNFTINHLAKIRIDAHDLTVRYIVDMAEIPTFQVMHERSIAGSQRAARLAQWGRDEVVVIKSGLRFAINGKQVDLVAATPRVSTRPGAGGLPTLYFVDAFRAALPKSNAPKTITVADACYSGRIGWKDIVISPDGEPTNELRSYPSALLGSPRSITGVNVTLRGDGRVIAKTASTNSLVAPAGSTSQTRSNLLSDMLAQGRTSPLLVVLTLLVAIGLGALHALEPGHGKTLLAVSLVGARATPKQALILAVALTFAHTAGVIAVGVVLLALAQWIVPENLYPWIALGSGALVAVLGAASLSRFVKARRGGAYEHSHSHSHRNGSQDHHHVSEAGSAPLSFRSVVLIAMSGNIAPCPAALVVLLTALALHQLGYGLLVIVAFSIGLAAVLTGLGIAVVHGASWLSHRRGFDRFAQYGPLLTAVVLSIIGAVMIGKASAGALQTPAWLVTLLVLAAVAGYSLSPGHTHAHEGQPNVHESRRTHASMLRKETT